MNRVNFLELLNKPKIGIDKLPTNFDFDKEAKHLTNLMDRCNDLGQLEWLEFINSGGSGMVFRVKLNGDSFDTAIKVSRSHEINNDKNELIPKMELDALRELQHPNVLQLHQVYELDDKRVFAIRTAYISNPQGLCDYVNMTLSKIPKSLQAIDQLSEDRLNNACKTVIDWFYQLANALQYMHESNYYHMDIKSANILITKRGEHKVPIITDMGACIRKESNQSKLRARFTLAYAHPDLTDVKNNLASVENGALRAAADITDIGVLPKYDLYAFGKTIQEVLAVIEEFFREKCTSNYYYNYLHVISSLLLDGRNTSDHYSGGKPRHGVKFVSDFPLNLTNQHFQDLKITSANELVERIKRYRSDYSINELAAEFDECNSNIINNTTAPMIPFTHRIKSTFNHITMRRLMRESQLGYMVELYPGASHNRWSHSLGVMNFTLLYLKHLLLDSTNPLFRIIANCDDISVCLISAIIHDIGQTTWGHDFEVVSKEFNHIKHTERLLRESLRKEKPLEDLISEKWGSNNLGRAVAILISTPKTSIDYLFRDIIDGAIDTDKLDYIIRDSYYCGLKYGGGIDVERLLNTLSISVHERHIRLAYYSKGGPAVFSLLLSRYHMYGSVYYHHTFRCIQNMLVTAFSKGLKTTKIINKSCINTKNDVRIENIISTMYYHRVICKKTWEQVENEIDVEFASVVKKKQKQTTGDSIIINTSIRREPNRQYDDDIGIDFVLKFVDDDGMQLIDCIIKRQIYKRVFSQQVSVEVLMTLEDRLLVAQKIKTRVLDSVLNSIKSLVIQTELDTIIDERIVTYQKDLVSTLVLVDSTKPRTIKEKQFPREIGDVARKMNSLTSPTIPIDRFKTVNLLLADLSRIQVYFEPEFFKYISIHLSQESLELIIKRVLEID